MEENHRVLFYFPSVTIHMRLDHLVKPLRFPKGRKNFGKLSQIFLHSSLEPVSICSVEKGAMLHQDTGSRSLL